jgi:DNA-binding GntR family transcriptional regulator
VERITVQRFLTKADTVAEWLRTRIVYGELAPGTRLQQEQIAARLNVSSTPVREAFGTLEAEGLLEREPHRGVVVARRDPADLKELSEVRALIEVLAIRRVRRQRRDVSYVEVERALRDEELAIRDGNVQAFRIAARNFHFALVRAARSPSLDDLLNVIAARPILNMPLDASKMLHGHRTHTQVLAAMKRRDENRAVSLISRHDHWYEDAATTAAVASSRQPKLVPK